MEASLTQWPRVNGVEMPAKELKKEALMDSLSIKRDAFACGPLSERNTACSLYGEWRVTPHTFFMENKNEN